MTAPLEPYRVILDYEALEDGFLDRIEDINIPFTTVDENGDMTRGMTQKLLSKSRERWARTLGVESLGKMLKGTGTALVLVIDDERFAEIKADMKLRKRRPTPANAGSIKPPWLFTKKKAREMGKKRFSLMTDAERKRHQRKAGKASGKSRRRKARLIKQVDHKINHVNMVPAVAFTAPEARLDVRDEGHRSCMSAGTAK